MKFKAVVSERGLRGLSKGFAPTLEKFGRTVQALLGPEDVHLVQDASNTDGPYLTARIGGGLLFERGTLTISSKHRDLIAFTVDLQLLQRVLQSAATMGAEALEVKLAVRRVQVDAEGATENRPFLSFTGRGAALNLAHDMPISQPYLPPAVEALYRAREHAGHAPYYLSLQQEMPRVQAVMDKLRSFRDRLDVGTTSAGDLHLFMRDEAAHVGTEFRGLGVVTPGAAEGDEETEAVGAAGADSAAARFTLALNRGRARRVTVLTRHFAKVLQCCQLTRPEQILCGIGGTSGGGHLHFVFVFNDIATGRASEETSLSVKLPVRLEQ